MNLCRNITAVVGFFLALTLSLSLAVGAVEYPPAIGPQSVVVLTVEFSDEKPECYPPVEQIEAVIFGMVSDYYQEVSYGQMFFEGYVTKKFYQIGSMDYYREKGSPSLGWNMDIVADAILAADEEVDYSAYRHVIVVLTTPRKFGWWISCPDVYADLHVETNDGTTVESGILLQGSATAISGWVNIRHFLGWIYALGMKLGLPDDTKYPPQLINPPFVQVHKLAWEKIVLGWIPPEKVSEVPLGTTTRVVLDPIEQNTTGTLVVKIVKTPESYWLVEARRPIGYDAYSPTLAGPDTPADVIGHPPIEGVLITRIIHPASAGPPTWRGLRIVSEGPPLGIGPNETAIFVNEEENLLIAVVEEVGLSYVIDITTADRETEIRKLLEQRPRFIVTDLDISPTRVGAKHPVTISVSVTNVGKQEGSCSVHLETQYGPRWYKLGYYVDTQRVTLAGGECKIVAFTVVAEDLGLWLVRVAGLEGEFTVLFSK